MKRVPIYMMITCIAFIALASMNEHPASTIFWILAIISLCLIVLFLSLKAMAYCSDNEEKQEYVKYLEKSQHCSCGNDKQPETEMCDDCARYIEKHPLKVLHESMEEWNNNTRYL